MKSHKDPNEREFGMPKGKYFDLLEKECDDDRAKLEKSDDFSDLQKLLHICERICRICRKTFYVPLDKKTSAYIRTFCYDCCPEYKNGYREGYNKRLISFKDSGEYRQVLYKGAGFPRRGQCAQCGKKIGDYYYTVTGKLTRVKITRVHRGNNEYDDDDQLHGTIELCESCHCSANWKEGALTGWKGYERSI